MAQNYQPSFKLPINQKTDENRPTKTTSPSEASAEINLEVPFFVQAPSADWNSDFKEACEEASLLMVDAYYKNYILNIEEQEKKLLELISWQEKNWRGHFDLTVQQTAKLAGQYLNYQNYKILNNPSLSDILNELNQRHPLIMPAAGQLLNNPHYRQPGPIYHMLIIKGYADGRFITNDPGTKFGHDYLYDYQTLISALHDFAAPNITAGDKKILVIYP